MSANRQRSKYLAFCTECGLPNRLTLFLLRQYVATDEYSGFYCGNCGSRNEFPDSVIEYIKEL
ncbi:MULTISPECIES: hypothetical protein [Priestia]|uniref:Uncharacterized protein n=4 Tax=Priestia TaxID=2800373 RepID=D5DQ74_PRIM1|nr:MULTISPECIES: hypothetical protein [Priestia]AVX08026.1 hypothetical protein CS527_10070 [Bacillus sp. Y-01]MBZ5480742.1 hypothetical protein [Bacillus sp. T_4]MCF6795841.1 hypothetical protein [Bacillus sp. ET1]MCJ7986548.1 hypothetical protein [Priestia sp. OVL9]MDH6655041.1 hypothetical protein [Bacillus sp. PvP124]MDP9574814.1 hypothetical protein [Bacillus sp. 1751]MEB2276339.1 hypothetical protein [Bacillus sp. ILBB4]RFB30058.1 hypothetical protein DZB87_06115 [Bacillus sp. ALD]RF